MMLDEIWQVDHVGKVSDGLGVRGVAFGHQQDRARCAPTLSGFCPSTTFIDRNIHVILLAVQRI